MELHGSGAGKLHLDGVEDGQVRTLGMVVRQAGVQGEGAKEMVEISPV